MGPKKAEKWAHRIDVNVEALAVPVFHVFPKEEHAIVGPDCLGKSMNGLLQRSNRGNLLLVTFWNAALIIGILL